MKKPNLLLIQGRHVARYVDGKQDQVALIDHQSTIELLKQQLEYFRVNGIETAS